MAAKKKQPKQKSVGQVLLQQLVDEIKHMENPWSKMSEGDQRSTIERVRKGVEEFIETATKQLASKEYPALAMVVDQVVFKDGVKATLRAQSKSPEAHDIADSEGETVTVVMMGTHEFLHGMDAVKAEPDQNAIPLESTEGVEWDGLNEVFMVGDEVREKWSDLFPGVNVPEVMSAAAETYDGESDPGNWVHDALHNAASKEDD